MSTTSPPREPTPSLAVTSGDLRVLAACPELEARFDRLLWLLGLSATERAFVRAAKPGNAISLLVFADWLEEQGRADEAEGLRRKGVGP